MWQEAERLQGEVNAAQAQLDAARRRRREARADRDDDGDLHMDTEGREARGRSVS